MLPAFKASQSLRLLVLQESRCLKKAVWRPIHLPARSCVTSFGLSHPTSTCSRLQHSAFFSVRKASTSTEQSKEQKETTHVSYLPQWAKEETQPPLHLRLLGAVLLVPLGVGSLAVHLLASSDEEVSETQESNETEDYSRVVLNWTLHYAGAVLSFAGATHWGMQLAEFGVPRRSDYMALYYLCRFSAPAVFVFIGWVASVLSSALPSEAAMWLIIGFIGMLSCDFLAQGYRVAPPWWFRWRAAFCLSSTFSVILLLLSERNLYLGQKPKIRM